MPPATGKTVGRVYVRVTPDSTGFRRDLKSDVEAAAAGVTAKVGIDFDEAKLRQKLKRATREQTVKLNVDVKTAAATARLAALTRPRTVTIRTDIQGAGLSSASRALSSIGGANLGGTSAGLSGISSGLSGIVGSAAKASAMLGGVSLAVGNLGILATGAVKAVAQLSGVLGLIPALGFAGGAVLGTLVIGFTGLKDAVGPAAEVRDTVKGLKDEFLDLRASIQANLFQTLAEPIQTLANN